MPTPTPCSMVVSQEFIIAAVELADAIKTLNTYKTPEDLSTMPREFWTGWVKAANVIQEFGSKRQEEAQG